MPRDSNGNTSPLPGTIVTSGETILPSQHNPAVQDIYAMLTQSLSRDGQGGMRSLLNMNGFRIINVGAAVLPGDAISLSQFQSGTPIGSVVDYAGDTPPDKWMMCYGQAISRTAYPEAFAACGVKFGSGDGTTTFNLPDYRGRVGVGKDDMGGADAGRMTVFGALAKTIGGFFGAAVHLLTIDEMPKHNHSGDTSEDGEHIHEIDNMQLIHASGTNYPTWQMGNDRKPTLPSGRHKHKIPEQGADKVHNNTQPSIVMNKIIKVLY